MTDTQSSTDVIASTVATLPASAAQRFGEHVAARIKREGDWHELSYDEVGAAIEEVALGLVDLGIEVGDRVCILADTRLEWTLASYGISAAGAVVVPVYPTNSPKECEWVAGNSGARAVFCEDKSQAEKIEQIRENLDQLEHVIGFEEGGGELMLEELRERGRGHDAQELSERQQRVQGDDAYTIVYTSGTTGPPKGVVLTHSNAMSVCQMVEELAFVKPGETTYLYLPLAHVFALTAQLASYDLGTTIVYYGGNTREILNEIKETKPTYLPSVPRIFEKLYTAATGMVENASEEQEQFKKAIGLGIEVHRRRQHGEEVSEEMEGAFQQADEQIFSRVRELFGGQIRQAVTGAAPIAPEILEFFYAAGVPVLEGWGMTETSAVGTVGTLENFKFGSVGRAMPGVEIRIAEEDQEILMRGPNVFREYWQNEEATKDTIDSDSWLHTGDIGELDDEGYLKITGRKKDIIITAGGKNLTPSNIENDLKQSRFISQAVMYGDRKPYPVALITLDEEEIVPWAQEQGLPQQLDELAESEKVRELIQKELDRANSNYAQVEQIKKFKILDHDFSVDSGELTPTLKVKRNVINDRYEDAFAEMYG